MEFLKMIEYGLTRGASAVWGEWLVLLLVGMGVYLTFLLKGVQIKAFRHALDVVRGKYDNPDDPGEITHFQALCTALSGTIGLGNIAGVAVAISLGGPGATFWMILVGFLGMVTKYSEVILGVKYRRIDKNGEVHGGPMHYMYQILHSSLKPVAYFVALCLFFAALGGGNMFQSNQVAHIFRSYIPEYITGIILTIAVGLVVLGGIHRIAQVTSKLVPFMGGLYVFGGLLVIFWNISLIPSVVALILESAFYGSAAVGGFTGAAFARVVGIGVQRACFSNEAGVGSATVPHSAAHTSEPVREGVVALLGPFIDTVVICSITAFVVIISGLWTGPAEGVALTAAAFDKSLNLGGFGFGTYFIPIIVLLFAYSTMISWCYYGERAWDFLTRGRWIFCYRLIFCGCVFVGSVAKLVVVLSLGDLMFGLMVFPNLCIILYMSPEIRRMTHEYFRKLKNGEFKTYR